MEWDLLVRIADRWQRKLDDDTDAESTFSSDTDSDFDNVDVNHLLAARQAPSRGELGDSSVLSLTSESAFDTIFAEHEGDLKPDGVGGASAAHPAAGDNSFGDLFERSVASYWANTAVFFPIIHRRAFEEAMRKGKTTVYQKRPTALLYGLSIHGVRHLGDVDPARKGAFIRWCLEKSSSISGSSTDLGSLQALVFGCQTLILSGLGVKLFPLIRRAAQGVGALYRGLETLGMPQTADQWIYREMVLRLYIVAASADVGQAMVSNQPSFVGTYFEVGRLPMPASDFYFKQKNAECAFFALKAACGDGGLPFIDISGVGWPDVAQVIKTISEGVLFTMKLSTMALYYALTYLRSQFMAIQRNIVPSSPSPMEVSSMRADVTFLATISSTPSTLLSEHGLNIEALFTLAPPVRLFTKELGHGAAQAILAMEGQAIDALLLTGFRNSAVERAVQTAASVESHLHSDATLRHSHFVMLAPVFSAGKVLLDALIDLQTDKSLVLSSHPKEIERSVFICAKGLRALAGCYGMQARTLSEKFEGMMKQAGVSEEGAESGSSSPAHSSGTFV